MAEDLCDLGQLIWREQGPCGPGLPGILGCSWCVGDAGCGLPGPTSPTGYGPVGPTCLKTLTISFLSALGTLAVHSKMLWLS